VPEKSMGNAHNDASIQNARAFLSVFFRQVQPTNRSDLVLFAGGLSQNATTSREKNICKGLQYCDGGRYLLSSDWRSNFYVLDTTMYRPHVGVLGSRLVERRWQTQLPDCS
jgi:hypothetical protein